MTYVDKHMEHWTPHTVDMFWNCSYLWTLYIINRHSVTFQINNKPLYMPREYSSPSVNELWFVCYWDICKRKCHYQTRIRTERRNFLVLFNRCKMLLSKKGWCGSFIHNVELSLRHQISIWQNIPADFQKKLHSLQQHVTQLIKIKWNHKFRQIGNANNAFPFSDVT